MSKTINNIKLFKSLSNEERKKLFAQKMQVRKAKLKEEKKEFVNEIKPSTKIAFGSLGDLKTDVSNRINNCKENKAKRDVLVFRWLLSFLVVCFAYFAMMILFAPIISTEQGKEAYTEFFSVFLNTGMLPLFGIGAIVLAISTFFEGTLIYSTIAVIMTYLGFFIQTILSKTTSKDAILDNEVKSYALYFAIAVVAGIIATVGINALNRERVKRYTFHLCNIGALGMFLLLRFSSNGYHGTYAWFSIGGQHIQLTEIIKLLAIISIVALLTNKSISTKKAFAGLAVVLLLNAIGFVIINELGTLIIICLTAILVVVATNKFNFKALLTIALVGIIVVGTIYGFTSWCNDYVESKNQIASQSNSSVIQQEDDNKSTINPLIDTGNKIYDKIQNRLSGYKTEKIDSNDAVDYQASRALRILMSSTFFGNDSELRISQIDSDFVFLFVLLRMGILIASGVIGMILLMMLKILPTSIKYQKAENSADGFLVFGLNLSLLIQTYLSVLSSTLLMPIIGVSFVFISNSGALMLYTYIVIMYSIFAMRKNRIAIDEHIKASENDTNTKKEKSPESSYPIETDADDDGILIITKVNNDDNNVDNTKSAFERFGVVKNQID